ncbi:tetratricopeptide repeat protein [Foetidibacter luteolus]|uniref:tetratricopeptide repeat protein n=1 Tax=Foetidibacter luteolus TaxID=2608880 RepID=UPI00129A45FC|nr:tetratricopeptide repeat protein [Foetidibacter luteolus]
MKLIGLFLMLCLLVAFNKIYPVAQDAGTGNIYAGRDIMYCTPAFDPMQTGGKAPLLQGLGNFNYTITTRSPLAQQYFSQGLALTYGFNHGEAARSFKMAISLDSACAMAYWGLAMVWGPNYNAALNPTSLNDINQAIGLAVKFSEHVTAREQALINAISQRFPKTEVKDITPFYEAYASAMANVYKQYPDDADIATLYAEALMGLHPWNFWLKDGSAQPWTAPVMNLLEKTLARFPKHPGAVHYYIHAIEMSRQAYKALPYADYLANAMPAAGHLVHMPSHIYIRTGDYHKAVLVNEQATLADSTYVAQCKVQGTYPMLYYPHNIHFLAAAAFFEGNSKKALDAAWMVSRKSDKKYLAENVTVQHFYIIPFYVMVHLGEWDKILQAGAPEKGLDYPAAIWHYARGMAYAAKKDFTAAEKELAAVKAMAGNEALKTMMIWDMNSAANLVNIALHTLEGEILGHQGKFAEAEEALRKAVAIEDILNYNEPPDWFFSTRHILGYWLLQAKQYAAAEKVYEEDLDTFKENGWALMGLYNSLTGQQKSQEAATVKKRFDKAWQYADIQLTGSRKI